MLTGTKRSGVCSASRSSRRRLIFRNRSQQSRPVGSRPSSISSRRFSGGNNGPFWAWPYCRSGQGNLGDVPECGTARGGGKQTAGSCGRDRGGAVRHQYGRGGKLIAV